MNFTKMEGLGNDYLYIYADKICADPAALSRKLSNRHFGAGSDGMIWILPSDKADFRMRIFNADGSEAMMCGNGIRCVGKYVHDKGYTDKKDLTVETNAGIKNLSLTVADGETVSVTVDMGTSRVLPPLTFTLGDGTPTAYPVDMGNPHAVTFLDTPADPTDAYMTSLGAALTALSVFPDGVNAEAVQILSPTCLRMRVCERGSGITMACGTGACAAVSAAVSRGVCPFDTEITVLLDGGALSVRVSPAFRVRMTGPARFVYEGRIEHE